MNINRDAVHPWVYVLLAWAFREDWKWILGSWICYTLIRFWLGNAYKLWEFRKENPDYPARFAELAEALGVSKSTVKKRAKDVILYSGNWECKETRGMFNFYGLVSEKIAQLDNPECKEIAKTRYPVWK